jgi:uncharacterized lipoprotein YbaY
MRMRLGVAAIVVGAALTLAGCKQKAPQPPSARPVVAGTVHAAAFKAAHRVPGEVAARFTTPLSFRIRPWPPIMRA